jgi:PAS domain S-box-containing protein
VQFFRSTYQPVILGFKLPPTDLQLAWGVGLLALAAVVTLSFLRRSRGARNSAADSARLSLLAHKTDSAVLITNHDGLIEWINEGFTRVSGHKLGDIVGKPPGAVLAGTIHNARGVQKIREGMNAGKPFAVELLCAHKSGHRYWLSINFTPVFDKMERLLNFVGVGFDVTARKRVEDELARLHKRNELLLNSAGDGIVGLDLQGSIIYLNATAAHLTAWDPAELIGKPASTIIYQLRSGGAPKMSRSAPDDNFLAAALQDGTVQVGETDMFREKDGACFAVEYTSAPIREGNNSLGTVLVFRDITDRRQSETMRYQQARKAAFRADIGFALGANDSLRNVLQKCAQSLVKHFEAALARIWTFNHEENMLELQASSGLYTHLDGQHAHIPLGTMKVGILAREGLPQITNDLLNDHTLQDKEWAKREKLAAFAGYPLLVEGRLVGVMAMFSRARLPSDTIEILGSVADSIAQGILRKRAEEKITQQAALLDKAQDAIMVIDLSHRITYWNRSAERLYGWSAREVQGKRADQLLFRDTDYFEKAKAAALEYGEWKGESCHVHSGDQNVVVESEWTLVHDDTGSPKSILIVNTDLTERKKIEAQFLRNQRMESIGTLAGGIAHDLNNALAPIMMSVEVLKQKLQDDQSRRMLSILESSAKRGADMVKQVLTFARGVDGERVLLQTRHLLKEVGKIVGETFPKTILLKTSFAENLWTIMGDATQLHQVLLNLAVNARDAMPEGGTLTLSAENEMVEASRDPANNLKPGFYVVIKVGDTGTGIPKEILDKIFEPFFTTKEMGKGTGLGLATVLGIVKSHAGIVQVQTEVGKGTSFVIYLPALENAATAKGDGDRKELLTGNGELILVVDDEASVLSMTKETLETYGYRVLAAKDGTEAVAAFTTHRQNIKLVLSDMLMPFMDGPATIRVLRKLDPHLRIIAASGLMDHDKVRDATGMDNIAFLLKPYTAEKLLTTVHKMIHSDPNAAETTITPIAPAADKAA